MLKKLYALVVLISASLLMGCGPLNRQAETTHFPMPKDDKKPKYVNTFTITPGQAYLTRFVWEGESIDNWTESLEIFNTWKTNFPPTPEKAYNMLVEMRRKKCPEAKATVLNQDNNSITYEINTINCPPHPDENSLNRILYGNSQVFNYIYTNKITTLPTETRDEWLRILSGAVIDPSK